MSQKSWNADCCQDEKDVVNLLWFVFAVVVASVDVSGTVILKVESVCGREQIFHDETLEHSLFFDAM